MPDVEAPGFATPLSKKLAGYSVIVAMLLGLVIAALQIVFDFREESRRLEMTIERLLQAAAPSATRAAFTLDDVGANQILIGLISNDFVIQAELVDEREFPFASVEKPESAGKTGIGKFARMIGDVDDYGVRLFDPQDPEVLIGELRIKADHAIGLSPFLDRSVLVVIFGFARNLVLAAILVWLFYQLLGRPLHRFITALSQVDPGQPAPVEALEMERHSDDELGTLANMTNKLLLASGEHLEQSHQVARTLARSEENYRQLVEGSIQGITLLRDDRILFANKAYVRMFGYDSPESLMALSSSRELLAPTERARLRDYYERRMSGLEVPDSYDFQGIRRDGTIIWLENRVALIDWEGQPTVQSVVVDISERKAAELALRNSEERFRTFVEGSPLPIFVKDLDGRVIIANRQFEAFHELNQDGAIGRDAFAFLPDDSARIAARKDQEILESRAAVRFEVIWKRRDGSLSYIIISKFPIFDSNERISAIGGYIIDVTELKRAEEQLSQSQKMQAVGQLTGGIAHDFNNILSLIMGNLELLGEAMDGQTAETALVQNAIDATERGSQLTHQLLAFSRKQVLSPQAIDARQVIAGMMEMLRRTLGENIEIETISDSDLWFCEADPAQMENALLNLAINARDAMPDGGKLTIEMTNAVVDGDPGPNDADIEPGRYVALSVSDTGVGMSDDVRAKVFEPFFTTKEIGQGTGLGLSMVYGFVRQSKGHITIDSAKDSGATFRIYLKRSEVQSNSGTTAAPPVQETGQGERVLVVEDDEDLRHLAVRMLGSLGYAVIDAADGATALARLDADPDIDLLFTDLVLAGGINGRALAERALSERPGLKVLYTSGYADSTVLRQGHLDTGIELLRKPYRKADLARKLRDVLGSAN